jgi:hypothetical protein
MAGNYPDVPGRRMAWDDDGSVVLAVIDQDSPEEAGTGVPSTGNPPNGVFIDQSALDKQKLNDESNAFLGERVTVTSTGGIFWYIFFPEKRELDGYYWNIAHGGYSNKFITHSEDSTNGRDGTFSAWGTMTSADNTNVDPDYRDNIEASALSNKRAVYAALCIDTGVTEVDQYMRAVHVYGRITPGETPDRLVFLDTVYSDIQYTTLIDYGDVPRGQTKTYTIKVKNNSTTLTANTVQMVAAALTGNSDNWYTFSIAGGGYQATAQLGSIGPGGSVLVTYKQAIPDAEVLGLHSARFKVNQASWS